MSHLTLRRRTLALGSAATLAAATLGLSLYVTHHSAAALATGPGQAAVTLEAPGGPTTVTLAPGSYHATVVLTDCGAVDYELDAPPDPRGATTQKFDLGRDDAPYNLHGESTPPPGFTFDATTGKGSPHTTTRQTDFTVSAAALFGLRGFFDTIYNSNDCTAVLTITPR